MSVEEADTAAHIGCIKFFDKTKGFGFIEDMDDGTDIYFNEAHLVSKKPSKRVAASCVIETLHAVLCTISEDSGRLPFGGLPR